jgi:choline/glycine/proline betaine transport protein
VWRSRADPPPFGDVEAGTPEAAQQALDFTLYHFGLHTWSIFGLPALGFAFFAYRRGLPMRVSSVLHPLLGDRIHGPIGNAIDIMAVLGTLFGVATSLGLGTLQINGGLSHLAGVEQSLPVQIGLIAGITALALTSVVLGLDKGIRRLSSFNILLAVFLLVFVLVAGPTLFLLRAMVESTGSYLTNLPQLAFWADALGDTGWQGDWTVFYWAWTITWAPFVGIFIARISRGRTIRQFVLGVLFLPTAFTLVWFTTFGFGAIDLDMRLGGTISELLLADDDNVPISLFVFLENFPLAQVVSGLAVLIVVIFFTTSSDSASFVIDMLASSDVTDEAPVRQRVFWAISEGVVAATLLSVGGLVALQEVITVLGLPFFVLGLLIIYSLVRGVRQDRTMAPQRIEVPRRPDVPSRAEATRPTDASGPQDAPREADVTRGSDAPRGRT